MTLLRQYPSDNILHYPRMTHFRVMGQSGIATFDFDSNSITFTAAMAKRKPGGQPFGAGIPVQGKADSSGTPDVLTFPQGAQISSNWYANFDPYQGSIVMWVTPEWSGNDNLKHVLLQWSANGSIYKDTDNKLYLSVASAKTVSTSISTWAAGTTYLVIVRWDSRNTLDGTNYCCITINNAGTFGQASSYTPEVSSANIAIGCDGTSYPANAIISGLTVYRRMLWDGTYGVDEANGNELAQIYNSGSGNDPTNVTGSWDAVFCLPTDASVGTLATTAQAWSHPHGSEIISDAFGQTTYGSSAWATVGTPASGPSDLAAADKVYQWGYKWTSNAADQGITQTKSSLTAGSNYVIRPVIHYDSTAIPVIKVLDATNGDAVITSMTLPNQSVNLITNGTFDTDASGWTAVSSAILSSVSGGQTNNCLQIQNGAASQGYARQSIQLAPYATYTLSWYHKNGTAQGKVSIGTSAGGTQIYNGSNTNDANWAQYSTTFNSGSTGLVYIGLWQGSATNGQNTLFDSVILTRTIGKSYPWCESFSFKLPTAALGAAANCTSIKVQIFNTTTAGTTYVHQIEVLPNLVENPSYEYGSGSPWLPTGYTNSGFVAGEVVQETANIHSGSSCIKFVNAAGTRTLSMTNSLTGAYSGNTYYSFGSYGMVTSGSPGQQIDTNAPYAYLQNTTGAALNLYITSLSWGKYIRVFNLRSPGTGSSIKPRFVSYASTGAFVVDDVFMLYLPNVTLAVTPASQTDSAETSGVRIDGVDKLTQATPAGKISATNGTIRWKYTPRHSAATVALFGNATPIIANLYGNATNYIIVDWSAANTLRLQFNANNAGVQSGTYNATGAIVAGMTYAMQIDYTATGMTLSINGSVVITITATVNFTTGLATAYWGQKQDGTLQTDGTFAAP